MLPAAGIIAAAATAAVLLSSSLSGADAGGRIDVAFEDGSQERLCEADLLSHTHNTWGEGDPGHESPEAAAEAYLKEERELNQEALDLMERKDPARALEMRDLLAPSLSRTVGVRQETSHGAANQDRSHGDLVFFDHRSDAGVLQSRIIVGELPGGYVVTEDYICMEVAVTSLDALEQYRSKEQGQ